MLDNAIHGKNRYPVNKCYYKTNRAINWIVIYPEESVIDITNILGRVTCFHYQINKVIQVKLKAGINVPDQLLLGFHIRVSAGDGVESYCLWSLWLREESMEYI